MFDLQPIKTRLAVATPGPWWASKEKSFGTYLAVAVVGCIEVQAKHDGYRYSADDDADLIAHSPTDLAALVAEVERLRGAIEAHRDSLDTEDGLLDDSDRKLWEALQ